MKETPHIRRKISFTPIMLSPSSSIQPQNPSDQSIEVITRHLEIN